MRRTSFAPTRRRRSPVATLFLVLLVLIIGFLAYLGFSKGEVPLERMEQDVTNEVAAR